MKKKDYLDKTALRRMVVFNPLKVIITNYEVGKTEWLKGENNAYQDEPSTREIPFSNTIYIESEDFIEVPPEKYFKLAPDLLVRLKSAYVIKCEEVIKDSGRVIELRCIYFPNYERDNNKHVMGVIHWVDVSALPIEVRLYGSGSQTLKVLAEPAIASATDQDDFQFIRKGYFCLDEDSTKEKMIFKRTFTL